MRALGAARVRPARGARRQRADKGGAFLITNDLQAMLSVGEIVVLAGAAIFLLGRKEGIRMIKQSGRTVNKFMKEMTKGGPKEADIVKKTTPKWSSSRRPPRLDGRGLATSAKATGPTRS